MVELTNYSPYPNFRYYSRDNRNREFGVIVVKGTFAPTASGLLEIAEEQAPMVFTDLCHGEVNTSSLWHPSDLVPNKPATDIILNAVARAPGGVAAKSWLCGVRVIGVDATYEKFIRIIGPRDWRPIWLRPPPDDERSRWQDFRPLFRRWELSEPQPITELAVRYEFAFGGEVPCGQNDDGTPLFDTDERNPIGCGKIDRDWTDHTRPVRAPQIEHPDHAITDPFETPTPQGLGPIPPSWLPRRPLGGTYDDHWAENVWPAWAPDYDFAFHNSAHPDLVAHPYLTGKESIELHGLSGRPEPDIIRLILPDQRIDVEFLSEDATGDRRFMYLDTVFLDVAAPDPSDWRVYLSWRVNYEPDVFDEAVIHMVDGGIGSDLADAKRPLEGVA